MFGLGGVSMMDSASLQVIKTYSVFPLLAFVGSLPVATWVRTLMVRMKMRVKTYELLQAGWLTLCFVLSVIFLVGQTYNPFIYFQF